jgi:hypothetical protein
VTVPFELDHNRMILEVSFAMVGGGSRPARAWVDTGNQYLILSDAVARDLGIDVPEQDAAHPGHSIEVDDPAPRLAIGGMPLVVDGIAVRVRHGALPMPGVPAEVNLPASALLHHHVVFDYPAGTVTIARPGALEPRGSAVPCQINPDTGLPLIVATIDGDPARVGLDNGSAGTWVSTALAESWLSRHPQWRHATGAAGSANFFGFPFETQGTLLELPLVGIGPLDVRDVTVLGLDQSLFDWYSEKSAGPVVGFLGANVLVRFRLEIDFSNGMTYWQPGPDPVTRDLDIVGLALRPEADGSFTVAGVVESRDGPVVTAVEAGDRLLRVGELDVNGGTMGEVVNALRGEPGERRRILLERDGEELAVDVPVSALP